MGKEGKGFRCHKLLILATFFNSRFLFSLLQQFNATLENSRKRGRVKSHQQWPEQPRCLNDIVHIERRDISTLTDEQFGCDEILTVLIPMGAEEMLNTSPKKQRSVAVWTVHEKDGQENRSLVANRVQVKKKQLDSPRRKSMFASTSVTGSSVSSRVNDGSGNISKHETGQRARNEHFAAYCETLKLDRKGEHNNPFAGKSIPKIIKSLNFVKYRKFKTNPN